MIHQLGKMKILACFLVLWICHLQTITAKFKIRYQALAIAYYKTGGKYFICDADLARKIVDSFYIIGYEEVFSSISFCCGSKKKNGTSSQLLSINALYETEDKIHNQKICKIRPQATLIQQEEFLYNIGFTIRDSEWYLTKRNLPTFINADQSKQRFPLMYFNFNDFTLQTREARHTFFLYRQSDRFTKKCEKFDGVIYNENLRKIKTIDLESFYAHDHQDIALERLNRPDIQLKQSKTIVGKIKNNYKSTIIYYEYFRMHQLIPIDDYTDKASRTATCSYVNIIPVWKYISKRVLEKVEIFIRKLANKLSMDTLDITTKTRDILTLPMKNNTDEEEDVYLDPVNNKIPVPKIIQKIITYRVPLSEINAEPIPSNNYYMVLWIYNIVPTWNIAETPCQDICVENGWSITADRQERNALFCCPMEGSLLDREPKVLNLKSVPKRVDNNGVVTESIDATKILE